MKHTKKFIEQSQVSAPNERKEIWSRFHSATSLENFNFFLFFFKIHLSYLQRKPNERMKIEGITNENLTLQCKNGMCSDS